MASLSVATSLETSVEARLSTLRAHGQQRKSEPFTIFRVPTYLRESNRSAYEPRMVSIGPYYHGSPNLCAMEDHKWRYLHDLLSRNATLSSAILIEEMRSLEARARACYSERPLLDSDDFVQMLLLDACFILEFFFMRHTEEPDALCDVGWGITLVNADLLLLENQIPFFVVERLYDAVAGAQADRESLFNLFLKYVSDDEPNPLPSATCEIHHLLHLYYESFVPKRSPTCRKKTAATCIPCAKERSAATSTRSIPCAKEMSAAGVTIVRRKKTAATRGTPCAEHKEVPDMDVEFDGIRGVMEIPAVVVDDMTMRPLLLNLIAFEQTKVAEESRVVTSYVSFMSMLIRGKDDVELLRRLGILDNLLADDDEAARFFSHLGDGVTMDYDKQVFAELCEEVRRYCASWRHRCRAALMRDYFGSPWSAISVVVAALVVALTATQTYFTVFPAQK